VTPSQKALAEIEAHQRECALRFDAIERRLESGAKKMDRLEAMLWGMYPVFIGTIIVTKFLD
tara:strand:+ start:159 stop:344 length:186 start_codon:yes stop_codon:yes gene_type:complete